MRLDHLHLNVPNVKKHVSLGTMPLIFIVSLPGRIISKSLGIEIKKRNMSYSLLPILLPFFFPIYGYDIWEPEIQCTVVKVYKVSTVFGVAKFPNLYDSINNDPVTSIFRLRRQKILVANSKTTTITENFERIIVLKDHNQLILELKGRPISRQGTLSYNGAKMADLTCH